MEAADGRYAICCRIRSNRPARGRCGGWVHRLQGASVPIAPAHLRGEGVPGKHLAALERRDEVYRRLLAALQLSAAHREQLHRRGYTPEEIHARRYRTLPGPGRAKLARECHNGTPAILGGVPGFWQKTSNCGANKYWSLAGSPGLVIPCLSPAGSIRGLRIRPDDPGEGGKYRWLSSTQKAGGTGSGVHCHVARPVNGSIVDTLLWIVEGEIKADLSAERLRTVVVSIPGVSCWSQALPDLVELVPSGGRVVVAMDADWPAKTQVHAALWGLGQACTALGYEVKIAGWDPTHKGLDDLLVAGQQPELCALDRISEPAWTLKVSSQILADAPTRRQPPAIPLATAREGIRQQLAAVRCTANPCD
jgi:hypothetical protein